jgi:uncharacterized membrane protein
MGRIAGSASADIHAPVAAVYAVAADVERLPEWQTSLLAAVVLDRNRAGRPRRVRFETPYGASILRFAYRESVSIAWQQEEGDLAYFAGSWRFAGAGGGMTRATCDVEVDLGRFVGLLVAGPIKSTLRERFINAMPLGLNHRVEALAADAGKPQPPVAPAA